MRHVSIAALAIALLGSAPAFATVMLKLELPQLVGRADTIFVGKVTKLDSHWTDDHKHIVTDATFAVVQNVRGATVGQPIVVRSLGGTVDGVGMRVFGSPQFQVGQEALLFTEPRKGHRYVTGMMQGAFPVVRSADGHARVQRSSAGLTLARRAESGRLETVREPAPPSELLRQFVSRIHETIDLCSREKTRCQRP